MAQVNTEKCQSANLTGIFLFAERDVAERDVAEHDVTQHGFNF